MHNNQLLNWVESQQKSLHTLFPFGKDLFCFSIYNPQENLYQLKSLKIRNADFLLVDSGVFDSYIVSEDLIIKILSNIDYLDAQTLVTESNSLKSIKRFVNKRVSEYLRTAPPVPIAKEAKESHRELSGEEIISMSSSASEILNQIRSQQEAD